MYYEINETTARRAKEMNSFSDYKPGSATAEYRAMVDKAIQIAERQKARVDPMYHERIDRLLDKYARKLAANMNKENEIMARVPSVLIAGPANFPVRAKEKQNAASRKNMEEWQYIQGLLDKIRSTGMGGISSDDPNAIEKLKAKLESLEQDQAFMKAVNAYYRKHKTLEGCPELSEDTYRKLQSSMGSTWRQDPKPFEAWALSNNNANIKRTRERIESLEKAATQERKETEYPGGIRVVENVEESRLQIFFPGKPDEETRSMLKSRRFRWAPKWEGQPWQRLLNDNSRYDAKWIMSKIEEKESAHADGHRS